MQVANLPLSGGMRFCFFLLGMLGFPWIMTLICYERFKARGQQRRVRQMFLTMLAGLVTTFALVGALIAALWLRTLLTSRP